jgi:hypothetical protein
MAYEELRVEVVLYPIGRCTRNPHRAKGADRESSPSDRAAKQPARQGRGLYILPIRVARQLRVGLAALRETVLCKGVTQPK